MTDDLDSPEPNEPAAPSSRTFSNKLVVLLVIAAVFAGVLVAKAVTSGPGTEAGPSDSQTLSPGDALAEYEAAISTGKPVYLLFHSLT